jgi:hypothetical protein
MYQENAQSSANVAQQLPAIINEFRHRNVTPDVILLDNSIQDVLYGIEHPWFEAVVRVLVETFPDAVIVSVVDGIPSFVNVTGNGYYHNDFTLWMHRVQAHYGLAVVDLAKMVGTLRLGLNQSTDDQSFIQRSISNLQQRQGLQQHITTATYSGENSTVVDLLWPQASSMITRNRTIRENDYKLEQGETYWLNFVPRSRKTQSAYYPENHPPWPTHQYVADAVMHTLLRLANVGFGCVGNDDQGDEAGWNRMDNSFKLEETVSPREIVEKCFICRSPLTHIDAKSPHNAGGRSIANLSATLSNVTSADHEIAVMCGDWRWVTDNRNRSGWQSDQYGSLIRFRLRVRDDKLPTLSLTYMQSHQTFGSLKVTFRTVSRNEGKANFTTWPLGCDDVDKFISMDELDNNATLVPSLRLEGHTHKYTQWQTCVFPASLDYFDVNSRPMWHLLNFTVLSRMLAAGSHDGNAVEYVDLYVVNPNTSEKSSRIKIQVVSSC